MECKCWLRLKSPGLSLLQACLDLGLKWYGDSISLHLLILLSFMWASISAACDSSSSNPHNCLRLQDQWARTGVIFLEFQGKNLSLAQVGSHDHPDPIIGKCTRLIGVMGLAWVTWHPWNGGLGAWSWFTRNHNSLRVGKDDFKEEIRTHFLDRVLTAKQQIQQMSTTVGLLSFYSSFAGKKPGRTNSANHRLALKEETQESKELSLFSLNRT